MTYEQFTELTHRGTRYPDGSAERDAYFNAADRAVREIASAKLAEARTKRAAQRRTDARMSALAGYGGGCATSEPV